MSESLGLRILYHTPWGRGLLKLLIQPCVSRWAGRLLDSRASRILIRPFMKANQIDLKGVVVPSGGFASFNEFFSRRRRGGYPGGGEKDLCSPCDGALSCFPIRRDSVFVVKHTRYSLAELLKDSELAKRYAGGTALIFRLAPANYHRYLFVDDGRVLGQKTIKGVLHCVRPIATEAFPVYIQNSREYVLFSSLHFGTFIQMEIGALLVGKIRNHIIKEQIFRGDEKGYFEYGGSTILLLFEKNRIRLREEMAARLKECAEVPVRQGEPVAVSD